MTLSTKPAGPIWQGLRSDFDLARTDNTSTPVYSTDANSEKVALLCGGDTWLQLASGAWQNIGNSEAVEAEIRSICDTSFPEFHPYVTVGGAEPTLPSRVRPD